MFATGFAGSWRRTGRRAARSSCRGEDGETLSVILTSIPPTLLWRQESDSVTYAVTDVNRALFRGALEDVVVLYNAGRRCLAPAHDIGAIFSDEEPSLDLPARSSTDACLGQGTSRGDRPDGWQGNKRQLRLRGGPPQKRRSFHRPAQDFPRGPGHASGRPRQKNGPAATALLNLSRTA